MNDLEFSKSEKHILDIPLEKQ